MIFSDENIAKLAFDMWGNCSNRLWDSLETYNSFLKSPQYRCFPMNFAKFLRTSFLQKTSGQLLLDFFYSFYCFACRWTYRNQSFYFWTCFITVFKRDEIMNLKDLVAATWKHISRWYRMEFRVFCRLINISLCTSWISVLHCPESFTHGTPKRQIKSKMKVEQAVILKCSVENLFSNIFFFNKETR